MNPLNETLPPPQRLALACATRRLRPAALALLALDAHLAQLLRGAREPMLAQMRLAWWRERLQEPVAARPRGDPLLAALETWEGHEAALVALVDGWEHLLTETLDATTIDGFAKGRAAAFAGLARVAGEPVENQAALAGERWALADLAAHLSRADERERVVAVARRLGHGPVALPRALRPLALLDGLARRAIAKGGVPLDEGAGAALTALRLGIFGR